MTYFALVDCNNFYASCERVFAPHLRRLPVVVLSNNDGCIIARSNEAKALGIKMGVPFWEIKQLIHEKKVQVFSSNYPLYGDMSARVMDVLHQHCADVEVYSIDEAFLRLHPYQYPRDAAGQEQRALIEWGSGLKQLIEQGTGIPVCVGIAKTKTLAKLANHIAKKQTQKGAYFLDEQDELLQELPIDEVWGIGSAYRRRLNASGIKTVAQLQEVPETWMRQEFGVVGLRVLKELNGMPCYDLEAPISARKNRLVSRSFSKDVYELADLHEALAVYATQLGEKLRKYQQATEVLTVFLIANPHKNKRLDKRTYFGKTVHLPLATSNTNDLISWAKRIASLLYEKGTNYKKAGICAEGLGPMTQLQTSLFTDTKQHLRQQDVMKTLDEINKKLGKNTVYMAACGQPKKRTWSRKAAWQSPRYTTKWADILKVN